MVTLNKQSKQITGLGCYLYFSPLSKLPVQTVAVCGYLEPLSAVVFAALLLHEKMSLLQVIGAVCILGGAMVGELVKIGKLFVMVARQFQHYFLMLKAMKMLQKRLSEMMQSY